VTEYRLHYRGTLFPIRSGEVILGRSSYASIVVNNPLTSREHAVVRSSGGRLEVADLGSKNGTYVNGKRIEGACRVDAGDIIKIGTDTIEIARMSAQDPQQLRVATEPGRHPAAVASMEGDTTLNLGRSLELAETLVQGAPVERRPSAASEILGIIVELLDEGQLDADARRRAERVLAELVGWGLSPTQLETHASVAARLAQGSAPPPH
jgi:pSer/pThr/pTyr-binding forkhead associated (FHA) protein